MRGLTFQDGFFPYEIPTLTLDASSSPYDTSFGSYRVGEGVEVSEEWAAAYLWAVREWKLVEGSFTGDFTVVHDSNPIADEPGDVYPPIYTASYAFSLIGSGEEIHKIYRRRQRELTEEDETYEATLIREQVVDATLIPAYEGERFGPLPIPYPDLQSWGPFFCAPNPFGVDGEGAPIQQEVRLGSSYEDADEDLDTPDVPVFSNTSTSDLWVEESQSASDSDPATARYKSGGGVGIYNIIIQGVDLFPFFRKFEEPEKLWFRPHLPGNFIAGVGRSSDIGTTGSGVTVRLSTLTHPAGVEDVLDSTFFWAYYDAESVRCGELIVAIDGFEEVTVPVFANRVIGGDSTLGFAFPPVVGTSTVAFSLRQVAHRWFTYGGIYDEETGVRE